MQNWKKALRVLRDQSRQGASAGDLQRLAGVTQPNYEIYVLRHRYGFRIDQADCPDGVSRFFIIEEPVQQELRIA
jgi:hypothetical protein